MIILCTSWNLVILAYALKYLFGGKLGALIVGDYRNMPLS